MISDLCRSEKIVGIYGLAKNTGKTVTLNTFISELTQQGVSIGITSIGRDGEVFDVINNQLPKPRITFAPRMLVATSRLLLRQSGLVHEVLSVTPYLTPLGQVVVARILEVGLLEIAGPGVGERTRHVAEIMLSHGAEKVLIDGAIDRRSASSPLVSDAIVMATGAALGDDIESIVRETVEAVQRVSIDELDDFSILSKCSDREDSFLLTHGGAVVGLSHTFALMERWEFASSVCAEHGPISHIVLRGAVCKAFLDDLIEIAGHRDIYVIATDSSKYYIDDRSVSWYERQGIRLRVLKKTKLRAVTVNPVYPPNSRLSSIELRRTLEKSIPNVAVRDVMDKSYPWQTV